MTKVILLVLLMLAPFSGLGARGWNTTYGQSSEGYCPWVAGYGWDGYLHTPTDLPIELHPSRQYKPGHGAIDINMPTGTPVYAAEDGIIVWSGTSVYGGGIMVKIAHGNNYFTTYAHLSSTVVECGQYVAPRQLIGFSGQTNTSWDHLHFAVNQGDVTYNPCNWFSCVLLDYNRTEPAQTQNITTAPPIEGGFR